MKFDDDKLKLDLIPPNVILELGKVLTYGSKKYELDSWKALDDFNNRYYAAALRHLLAWRKGEDTDVESGLLHLSHALTNISFLLWKKLE
jgi:hypothetical protein